MISQLENQELRWSEESGIKQLPFCQVKRRYATLQDQDRHEVGKEEAAAETGERPQPK